jgi:hypothetical protein
VTFAASGEVVMVVRVIVVMIWLELRERGRLSVGAG